MMGRSVGMCQFKNGGFQDLELHSRAAVAEFKMCSRVHIDKSIYDFVHHADSV